MNDARHVRKRRASLQSGETSSLASGLRVTPVKGGPCVAVPRKQRNLMPDHRRFHQIMQIPRLVEIQLLGLSFNLQRPIRFNLRPQVLA